MGTPRRIESSERYCWPQHEFEISRGENVIPDFDELPEPVRRKLRYLIERGAVRVLDGGGVEQVATDAHTANQNDATSQAAAEVSAAAESPSFTSIDPHSVQLSPPVVGQDPSGPFDVGKIFDLARDLAALGTALGNPLRAAILIVLASGRALAPSELARLLGRPRQTVSWHALFLERGGLLISERESGVRRYRISARAAERVALLLRS